MSAALAADAAEGPFALVVKPGGFDERCLRLQAGEAIDYDFAADAAVDFNVHHHRGREVFYPVRQSGLRKVEHARFVATATDDFCLMWENRGGAPVRIEGRIERSR